MVFTNQGKTAVRNWLAGLSTSSYPAALLWGTQGTTANVTDASMIVAQGKGFTNTDVSVTRQIQWESQLLSTELTTSTIRKIGFGTGTSGAEGTVYLTEDVAPITKTDAFDLQTLVIGEVL
jgi:hypothetical protein